jgi:hypothetical protein
MKHLKKFNEKIRSEELTEDTSATGGPAVSGMGPYVNAQPSSLPGVTSGPNWINTGGMSGDGSIAVPFNPSGNNRMFQKMDSPMGKDHGPRTGKKSRTKKIDLKSLKDIFAKRQDFTDQQSGSEKERRVLDFNDFLKNDFNTIKK